MAEEGYCAQLGVIYEGLETHLLRSHVHVMITVPFPPASQHRALITHNVCRHDIQPHEALPFIQVAIPSASDVTQSLWGSVRAWPMRRGRVDAGEKYTRKHAFVDLQAAVPPVLVSGFRVVA